MGGGGVVSFTNIIVSDLVPLKDRGFIGAVLNLCVRQLSKIYITKICSIWAAFAAVGPVVGGALANAGQWRWLFYLNPPVCGLAFVLVYILVNFDVPTEPLKDRVRLLDWPYVSVLLERHLLIFL